MAAIMVVVSQGYRRSIKSMQSEDEKLRLVLDELEHRSRNVLAVVGSMAQQTFGRSQATEAFQSRLNALAKADRLVAESADQAVDIEQLLTAELHAYGAERYEIDGPGVLMPAPVARAAALIIHELATNAAKYGALSGSEGKIVVTCQLREDVLHVQWKEHDGPPVLAPKRQGFGTRLLRSLNRSYGIVCDTLFHPDGVEHRIAFPVGP